MLRTNAVRAVQGLQQGLQRQVSKNQVRNAKGAYLESSSSRFISCGSGHRTSLMTAGDLSKTRAPTVRDANAATRLGVVSSLAHTCPTSHLAQAAQIHILHIDRSPQKTSHHRSHRLAYLERDFCQWCNSPCRARTDHQQLPLISEYYLSYHHHR